jgi:hypothetical protein
VFSLFYFLATHSPLLARHRLVPHALQDTPAALGPTELLPQSHLQCFRSHMRDVGDDLRPYARPLARD